jgi:hypothetical protein
MSESTHNAGIRIGGDAKGAVEAAKQTTDGLKALEEQGKKTGEQAKRNAEESRRFVERLKEEAETLGKSKTQIEQYRAAQLTLNDAQKKSVEASVAQVQAYDKKQQMLQALTRAAAIAGVALAAYVTAQTLSIKGAIDEAAALHNVSQSYGISTETLSGYRYQMALAGVGQAEFNLGVKALAKNIAEARGGVGDGSALFRLLGKDIDGAVRSGASIEKLLPMIAERFSQFADGPNKAALAMALFGGRIGEQLIPELNKGVKGFRDAAAEAQEFGRIVGGDAARRAEEFNTNLARTNMLLGASKQILAAEVVPALNAMIAKFIEARREGDGLASSAIQALRAGGTDVQKAQRELAEATEERLEVQNDLERMPRMGGWAGTRGRRRLEARRDAADARIAQARAVLQVNEPGYFGGQSTAGGEDAPGLPSGNTGASEYTRLTSQLGSDITVLRLEAQVTGTEKLTEAQRKRAQIEQAVNDGVLKLTDAELSEVKSLLDTEHNLELQRNARERQRKAVEEGEQALTRSTDAQRQWIAQTADENRKLGEHNQQIGLTAEQLRALRIARAEETVAIAEQNLALTNMRDASEDELEVATRRLELARETVRLVREGGQKEAVAERDKKLQDETDRNTDYVRRTLSDALLRGFENGSKRGWQVLKDTMVNMSKTLVLEPLLRPMLTPIANWMTGATATGGAGINYGQYASAAGSAIGSYFRGDDAGVQGGAIDTANRDALEAGDYGHTDTSAITEQASGFSLFGIPIGAIIGAGISIRSNESVKKKINKQVGEENRIHLSPLGALALNEAPAGKIVQGQIDPLHLTGWDWEERDYHRMTTFAQAFGQAKATPSGPDSGAFDDATYGAFARSVAAGEQNLVSRRQLTPQEVQSLTTAMQQQLDTRIYRMGRYGDDWNSEGIGQQILADRMRVISDTLGESIEDLTLVMTQSAKEWAQTVEAVQVSRASMNIKLGGLPGALGITTLEQYQHSLAVSEYSSPEDRLGAARTAFTSLQERARLGDISAIQALPQSAQELLGIGRDMYASGGGFQDLRRDVEGTIAEVLDQQRGTQREIMGDLVITIEEASQAQITVLRSEFGKVVAELVDLKAQMKKWRIE